MKKINIILLIAIPVLLIIALFVFLVIYKPFSQKPDDDVTNGSGLQSDTADTSAANCASRIYTGDS